jgi:putative ABC transport system permease protein
VSAETRDTARALLRVARGQLLHRPLQSVLLVLGVALGVAVVVAIDLANGSALAAFRLSTEAIAGRATHRVVGGPEGLDEAFYARLRTGLGLRDTAPVVEGRVAVPALGGAPLTLLGVDAFAEPPFRNFLAADGDQAAEDAALTPLLTRPGTVLLSRGLAERAGVAPGGRLALETGAARAEVTVAALLEPADDLAKRALDNLVLADVATAQELLGKLGRLDRVDLLLPRDEAAAEPILARLRSVLPPGAQIVPADDQQATVASMTSAFRLNLTALSLLALLVGMFLIFNTMRFSVVQRRPLLGTLRTLGVTRREVFALILAEALLLGSVGVVLGLGLGVVLGRAAVALVTQTVNDLYFAVTVQDVAVPAAALLRGGLLGLGAALLAAALPAWEATAVPPVSALRRSDFEAGARSAVPRSLAAAVGCALLSGLLLGLPGERVDLGFAALAALVFGFALLAPAVTLALMALAAPLTGRLLGPIGRMAPRDVTRALSRTAVAIAALMVAVCVSIGVSLMVDSFRRTVVAWLADTLQADVFVSPVSAGPGRIAGVIPTAALAALSRQPEVARLATARPVTLRSPELGPVDVVAIDEDIAGADRRYLASKVPAAEVWDLVRRGGAVTVAEPFMRRTGRGLGDTLTLDSTSGPRRYEIVGVFYDYGSQAGTVFMADSAYRDGWDDEAVTTVALTLVPGVDADAFARELPTRLPEAERLTVQSNRGLRSEVIEVFDRAFAITTALQLLAILVAFIGVLSALMALQLERQREFATLRATGLTRPQLGALSFLETGLVGTVAGLLSWPAGLSLALVLIYVINRRSFGWTIQTHLDGAVFLRALALAVAAALLAGAYPAWRLGKLSIARALREE